MCAVAELVLLLQPLPKVSFKNIVHVLTLKLLLGVSHAMLVAGSSSLSDL